MAKNDTVWIESLSAEHARLEALLDRLEERLSLTQGVEGRAQFPRLLGEVALHCRRHMECEEQGGYFAGVLERKPSLAATVAQLRAQHVTLLAELADCMGAVQRAPAGAPLGEPLLTRVRQWIKELRTHEMQENDVSQAAYNDDAGSAD